LLSTGLFTLNLRGGGFAPRHLNRSPPRGGRTTILTLLIRLENRIKLSSAILSLKTDAPFLANASRHSALNRKLCEGKLGRGENKLEWLAELNAPRENDGGGEQFNGREGETATLLSTAFGEPKVARIRFRPTSSQPFAAS